MNRTESREVLMQVVFQMDAQADDSHQLRDKILEEHNIGKVHRNNIENSFELIKTNLIEIDKKISEKSSKWSIDRMARTDLAILRVAVGEIFYDDSVPTPVAINEAVNMAKKFGNDSSPKYINGVLGAIVHE